MLNSGEKNFARRATKKINILTLVLSEEKILNEAKNHNPPSPSKLNGRSLRKKTLGKFKNNVNIFFKSLFITEWKKNKLINSLTAS